MYMEYQCQVSLKHLYKFLHTVSNARLEILFAEDA